MKSTDTGLADLAQALRFLNPKRRDCPAVAELLGLRGSFVFQQLVDPVPASEFQPVTSVEAGDEERESLGPAVEVARPSDPDPGSQRSKVPYGRPPERPRPPSYRDEPQVAPPSEHEDSKPTALTLLRDPASAEMPSFISEAEDINFPDAARQLPAPEPIVSDAQLRALVTKLISVPRPGEPDVERIVAALANGKPLRQIPRKTRSGVVQHVRVWIDTANAMRLFQVDAARALRAIRRVAGGALRSETFIDGPPPVEDLPRRRDGLLLILSTLGIGAGELGESQTAGDWRRVAAACESRGLRPVAMVPFQPARWPRDLQRGFHLVPWHPPGARARSATPRELRRLANVLALAAVIDPALLRAARRRILPEVDASAEIDFANSPWVGVWNPRVISMYPKALETLRSELALDGELLETARTLVNRRPTSQDWSRVVFEENLVYVALKGTPEDQAALETDLFRVIKSLLGRLNNSATARWALLFLSELPSAAQQTRAALLLRAVASMLLSTAPSLVADIAASEDAAWIFQGRTAIGVTWTGRHIVIHEPPYDGDSILNVPSTRPMIVMVTDVDGPRQKVLRLTRHRSGWTRATYLPRLLKTVDGAVYRLDDAAVVWARARDSLDTQKTIPGVVRGQERGVYLVDIGLGAKMSEASVLLGGGTPHRLEGQEVQVRVMRINDTSKSIRLAFGPLVTPTQEVWREFESCYSSFQTIRGTVNYVGQTGCRVVMMNFNTFLSMDQLARDDHLTDELLGRELDFQIISLSTDQWLVYVTRRIIKLDDWRKVRDAFQTQSSVNGTIIESTTEGFQVSLQGGISAFLPIGRFDESASSELSQIVGKTIGFHVLELDDNGRSIVLDRLKMAKLESAAERTRFLQNLRAGDILTGKVKNVTSTGAFVDLAGIDGLLKTKDITWCRPKRPSEMLKVGMEVTVKVLDVDKEKERVSLGLKQLQDNPWDKVEERFPIGTRVKGKITNLVPYGAFMELGDGVEGLIHVSEFSWTKRVTRPADVLKVDQEVEATVLAVNKEEQKISLGLRQLESNPWDEIEKKYPPGTVVKGKVRNMTAYGAFVEIEGGIGGMIHVSDMSWTRKINQPSEMLKKGDEVKASVIDIDKQNQRISLGMKQLGSDPWKDIDTKYKIGDLVTGKVTKLASFGAFVQLKDDIDGLVHISQLSEDHVSKVKDILKVGQDVEARVIKVDKAERRVGLSIKAANYSEEDLKREIAILDSLAAGDDALGPG